MNNDIVPSLLEEIQKQFDEEIKANEKIKSILIRQKQGAVDYTDSLSFAKELGVSLKKVIQEDEKIYLEGANKSFELPEFNSLAVAKNFINVLDTKELVADMLNSGIADDIQVYIGEESEKEQLKDFSVVTFKHKINGKDLGTIGIIGPKRMDYSKVISVMKYINKKLNGNDKLGGK